MSVCARSVDVDSDHNTDFDMMLIDSTYIRELDHPAGAHEDDLMAMYVSIFVNLCIYARRCASYRIVKANVLVGNFSFIKILLIEDFH